MEEGPNTPIETEDRTDPAFRMKLSELIATYREDNPQFLITMESFRALAHKLLIDAMVLDEVLKKDLALPILIKAVDSLKTDLQGIQSGTSLMFLKAVFGTKKLPDVGPSLDPLEAEPPKPSDLE
jgi:hypothetical protein